MSFRTELDPGSVRVTVDPSRPRITPEGAERRFRALLEDSADVLLAGIENATGVLPGGAIISATIRGARSGDREVVGWGGERSTASSLEDVLARQSDMQMQYIHLQQRIQDENRRYTTLSNVLKARHETAKTAIGNIR